VTGILLILAVQGGILVQNVEFFQPFKGTEVDTILNYVNLPLQQLKTFPSNFTMEHLLQGLYGIDVPIGMLLFSCVAVCDMICKVEQ